MGGVMTEIVHNDQACPMSVEAVLPGEREGKGPLVQEFGGR